MYPNAQPAFPRVLGRSLPSWGLNTHSLRQRPQGKMPCGQSRGDLPHSPQTALVKLGPAQGTLGSCPDKVKAPRVSIFARSGALISGLRQECNHQERGLWPRVTLGR